ncbi:hypothetical protein B0H14DRAFT_310803 [Mycena olivaceomarginata]|nr:hypothetical protein B0H14DRAFT_310803 [Mycena olivaceomarginata]
MAPAADEAQGPDDTQTHDASLLSAPRLASSESARETFDIYEYAHEVATEETRSFLAVNQDKTWARRHVESIIALALIRICTKIASIADIPTSVLLQVCSDDYIKHRNFNNFGRWTKLIGYSVYDTVVQVAKSRRRRFKAGAEHLPPRLNDSWIRVRAIMAAKKLATVPQRGRADAFWRLNGFTGSAVEDAPNSGRTRLCDDERIILHGCLSGIAKVNTEPLGIRAFYRRARRLQSD